MVERTWLLIVFGAALLVSPLSATAHDPVETGDAEGGSAAEVSEVPSPVVSGAKPTDRSGDLLILLYIFVLASFLGHQLITRVPPLLHTPLMSGTNAISGISLVGSLVAAGLSEPFVCNLLGGVAVGCAMCNVVGGFAITDRMLAKFRKGGR